jgi:hypothetical protein
MLISRNLRFEKIQITEKERFGSPSLTRIELSVSLLRQNQENCY